MSTNSQATISHFEIDQIQTYLNENPNVTKVEDFIRELPKEFRQQFVIMIGSESMQPATPEAPRVILIGETVNPIFAFNTARNEKGEYKNNDVEMIRFNAETKKFEFHKIHLEPGKIKLTANDPSCTNCHGKNPRPNWDPYDHWANALPFNKDRVFKNSEEDKWFRRIFVKLENDPRFGQLEHPQGSRVVEKDVNGEKKRELELPYDYQENPKTIVTAEGLKIEQGGAYYLNDHPKASFADEGQGSAMFDRLTPFNAARIAEELRVHPGFNRFRYAVAGIIKNCAQDGWPTLSRYAPYDVFTKFTDKLKVNYDMILEDTKKRQANIVDTRAKLQKITAKKMIRANAAYEGVTYDEATLDQMVTKEIYRRNNGYDTTQLLNLENGFPHIIAQLRYLLESEDIPMSRWSMSVNARSATYTFSDLYQNYFDAIKQVVGDVDCANVATMSMQAYEKYPLP